MVLATVAGMVLTAIGMFLAMPYLAPGDADDSGVPPADDKVVQAPADGDVSNGGSSTAEAGEPTSDEPVAPSQQPPAENRVGFQAGVCSPTETIKNITVTLKVGEDGAALDEAVNLHLGIGLPLRLYPLGDASREPAFALFPQTGSLEEGQHQIEPGGEATFQFAANPGSPGLDVLNTTPELMAGLKVADVSMLGFASQGKTNWKLAGYSIEINGKPFASHDSVERGVGDQRRELNSTLAQLLPPHTTLGKQVGDLKAYVATGLASDEDRTDLVAKERELAQSAEKINRLGGQVAGYYPWYVEDAPELASVVTKVADPIKSITVKLFTGGSERPGTRNPIYLRAGGRKYLLSSEVDPLSDESVMQEFQLQSVDLDYDPLPRGSLADIGIGMIGNDQKFASTPDRASLQRVVVSVNGEDYYDSENNRGDRKTLSAISLVPPAHRDLSGTVVENRETDREKYSWQSGMPAPAEPNQLADVDPPSATPAEIEPPPSEPIAGLLGEPLPNFSEPTDPLAQALAATATTTSGGSDAPNNGVSTNGVSTNGASTTTPATTSTNNPAGNLAGTPAFSTGGTFGGSGGGQGASQFQNPTPFFPFNASIQGRNPGVPIIRLVPPVRRTVSNPNQLTPIVIQFVSPGNQTQQQTVQPIPAPRQAIISNVHINNMMDKLFDGDQTTVEWELYGDTTNVSKYRVELFGVLPHKTQTMLRTPVAVQDNISPLRLLTSGGRQDMSARLPAINLSQLLTEMTAVEKCYLYVQPKVTAFNSSGAPLTSNFGPLLAVRPYGPEFSMALNPNGVYTNTPFNGIESGFIGLAARDNLGVPLAWQLLAPQDTHYALTFDRFTNTFRTRNNAFRPGNTGDTITFVYNGVLPDTTSESRIVAHIGYIGNALTNSTCEVLTRLDLSWRPGQRFFRLETPAPIEYSKFVGTAAPNSPNPMLLIDLPIRMSNIVSGNMTAYPHDRQRYGNPDPEFNPVMFAQRPNSTWPVMVELTFMINKKATPVNNDAIGVFGTRLITDQ